MNNFIALILVLTSTLTYAQTETSTDTVPIEAQSSSESTFGISLETTSFIYKEPLMKQSGTMNGFNLFGKYRKNSGFALNANLNYLKGKLEYDGALMSGTPIKSEDTYDVLDVAANGEFQTELSTSNDISFLVGLGRRVTTDENDPSASDYKRVHTYNYLSLAGQVVIPHSGRSATTAILEIQSMLSGNVKTYLSDVDKSLPDMDMSFNGGTAIILGASFSHKFDVGRAFVGLNYKQWSLSQSESQTVKIGSKLYSFVEPQNTTSITALDVGLLF